MQYLDLLLQHSYKTLTSETYVSNICFSATWVGRRGELAWCRRPRQWMDTPIAGGPNLAKSAPQWRRPCGTSLGMQMACWRRPQPWQTDGDGHGGQTNPRAAQSRRAMGRVNLHRQERAVQAGSDENGRKRTENPISTSVSIFFGRNGIGFGKYGFENGIGICGHTETNKYG
jgi:hypothetical protein